MKKCLLILACIASMPNLGAMDNKKDEKKNHKFNVILANDKEAVAYYKHNDEKNNNAEIHLNTNTRHDTCDLCMYFDSEWFRLDQFRSYGLDVYSLYSERSSYKKLTKKDLVCATLFKLLEHSNASRQSTAIESNDYTNVDFIRRIYKQKPVYTPIEHKMRHAIKESLKTSLNEFEQECTKKE